MYETEANTIFEAADQIPSEVLAAFSMLRGKVTKRTVLPWSEHCTECVWPSCYSTCDLYSPREDGRCRRFVDGMVRIDYPDALNHYLLKIRFKRWGKLWTPGNVNLHSIDKAENIEKRDQRIGSMLYKLPLAAPIRRVVVGKRYGIKKRMALRTLRGMDVPTSFLLECYNPHRRTVLVSFTIRPFGNNAKIPFQKLIELQPGFQAVRVPFREIAEQINTGSPFHLEIIPNEIGEEITLYFGLMEFVQELTTSTAEAKKIKCVVWDLDNTLWDGILVEDGEKNLALRREVVGVIKELDRRGILNSIASKNNYDDAMQVLRKFELDEFFVSPQISWDTKGNALARIAAQLNLGPDTLLFVDDSDFELQQVKAACPGVRVLNARDFSTIPQMEDCRVPVTAESIERRKMYQVERVRQDLAQTFKDDYKAFLCQCRIQLQIGPLNEENLERVHELTQRTNQMNFSGNRYDRGILRKILGTPYLDTYVLSCEDRFGSYGIIGFGIVDGREHRMTDLMFSCRVQSKRVEHAFLAFVLRKYIASRGIDFHANYRKTSRNLPSGQVFTDLGMREVGVEDGVTDLVFPADQPIPDDKIITIATGRPLNRSDST